MKLKLTINSFLSSRICVIGLAILCGSTSGIAVPTTSASRQIASSDDFNIISQIFQRIDQGTPEESSAAIKLLAQFRYVEVETYLINILAKQFKSGKINPFIVNAAIDSLKNIATSDSNFEIQNLTQMMAQSRYQDPKLSNDKTFNAINSKMAELAMTASNSSHSLPRLGIVKERVERNQVSPPTVKKENNPDFQEGLRKKIEDLIRSNGPSISDEVKSFLGARPDFITDEILEDRAANDHYNIKGREKEANETIDILTRSKGKNPVLVGPRGSGKTSITMKVAEMIIDEAFPQTRSHVSQLKGAYLISTTPAKISMLAKADSSNAQGAAIEQFLDSIIWLEKSLNRKIILFIDEFHTLDKAQVESMKPYLDSRRKSIRLIGASTSNELQNSFKNNPAFLRRIEQVGVSEQTFEEVLEIVKESKVPDVKRSHNVTIDDEAIDTLVKNSQSLYPDKSFVDASVTALEDIAIKLRRLSPEKRDTEMQINEQIVFDFVQSKLKFPVNPLDADAITKYRADLVSYLNEEVIGQERMVIDVVDQWINVLMGNGGKSSRSVLLLGETGTGKSLLGRKLSEKIFGHDGAFLEIDGNDYKTGGYSTNIAKGAPNGVLSSDLTAGKINDFLDDPGRGKLGGVIVINEIERAHADFRESLMEMIDRGYSSGGDGKDRKLSKHIIIFTSNRGDRIVWPAGASTKWSEKEIKARSDYFTSDKLKEMTLQMTSGTDERVFDNTFVGRIDSFSLANPITKALAQKIAQSKVAKAIKEQAKKFKISITADPSVAIAITESSYTAGMGTRPVEKAVEKKILDMVLATLVKIGLKKRDTVSLKARSDATNQFLIAQANGKSIEELLPRAKPADRMEDPEFLEMLSKLEANVAKRIVGQDEAVKKISDSIIAHEARGDGAMKALAFFLVGATGTGKTALVKALAEAFFGSPDRASIIPVGHVRFDGHLQDIFGSSKGFSGSRDIALFEQALMANPDGGFIAFDEASNMGGNDKSKKNELFKHFYNIIDEAKWTSPATNKTYDLRKYKFVFTGNDGEKLTQGMSSDDMKLAAWGKAKGSAEVRALLLEAGVPEALLGRMSEILLFKPLLKIEVSSVAGKLFTEALKGFSADGIKFEFTDDFFEKAADAFYASDKGARSLRDIADKQLSLLVAKAIFVAGGKSILANNVLKFSMTDNKTNKIYASSSQSAREVNIIMEVFDKEKNLVQRVVLPATDYASIEVMSSKRNALATAYHEAGHAIVNDPRVTGMKLAYITIRGVKLSTGETLSGYTRYERAFPNFNDVQGNEAMVIIKVAQLVAGQMAQKLAGFGEDSGWSNDLEKTNKMISEYLVKWGLIDGLKAVRVNKKGEQIFTKRQTELLNKNMERIFKLGEELAKKRLTENWNLVRAIVGELFHKGTIDEARFNQISKSYANQRVNKVLNGLVRKQYESNSAKTCGDLFTRPAFH